MDCQQVIDAKGKDSKYAKDCLIRLVRGKSFSQAAALLGWADPPPIIIHAGIGTLVIGTEHQDFTPTPTIGKMARSWIASLSDRTPATKDQIGSRTKTCDACPLNANGSCSMCGCGLSAKIRLANQTCPNGMW